MNIFFGLLHGVEGDLAANIAKLTAEALLAGLWQGVLLNVAAGLLLRVMPKSTAATRFFVWAAVFCVSVAMPFMNLPHAGFAGRPSLGARSQVIFDLRWSYLLSGIWLTASLYRLAHLGLQAAGLRALWMSARPVRDDRRAELGMSFEVSGRTVELCTSDEVDRPSVIGFLAPRILIPAWLFEQLTAVELNHIVLHEMEHLRRRDDWVNLLQKIGLVLLPLNPALFWIDRRLSTERELACDDGVLEKTNAPRAYAASLASIAERRIDARRLKIGMLALAATGLRRRSELGRRIESILGMKGPVNRGWAGCLAVLLVAGVVGAGVELARLPQLVSFGPDAGLGRLNAANADGSLKGRTDLVAGVRAENVSFHTFGIEGAASLPERTRSVRQRLKPRGNGGAHATTEAVAESTTEISADRRAESSEGSTPTALAKTVTLSKADASPDGGHAIPAALVSRRKASPGDRLVVLTLWDGDQPVARVAVATRDGKFVFVPYAAVPTEAGWLLLKL